jgi:hypothetical protein
MSPWRAVPDRGLIPGHHEYVNSVLCEEFEDSEQFPALLTGSLAAGLGHAESDLDVLLVGGVASPETRTIYRDGHPRLDIIRVPAEQWDRFLAIAAAFTASMDDRSQVRLSEADMFTLIRYSIAQPLDRKSPATIPRPDTDAVARIIMARSARNAGSYAEDAAGSLACGDVWTALAASRNALCLALECALAADRDFYTNEKFLFRRVARAPSLSAHTAAYWQLAHQEFSVPASGEGAAELTCRRLIAANGLIAGTLLFGWDGPPQQVPAPVLRDEAGIVRSPFCMLTRYSDGLAIVAPNEGYEVNDSLAVLWYVLDGVTARGAAERYNAIAFAPAEAADLDGALEMMLDERTAYSSIGAVLTSVASDAASGARAS